MAPPGEDVANFYYLLQHGANIVTANATRHMAIIIIIKNVLI